MTSTEDFTYCPRCGAPLNDGTAFGRTRRLCRHCGFIQFREPKVAVAALTRFEGRVLLVRRAAMPRVGFWALPAGYIDYDELPETAVVREVAEETGITIRPLGLNTIVPLAGWQEPRGILLVYWAERVSGEIAAHDDVSAAGWFAPAEIPWDQLAFESTAQLLRQWATGQ